MNDDVLKTVEERLKNVLGVESVVVKRVTRIEVRTRYSMKDPPVPNHVYSMEMALMDQFPDEVFEWRLDPTLG